MRTILILLVICISFGACNNGEIERLRQENASLKAQVAELSETEQNRFNKAVDLFNTANDLRSYRLAEKTFASFIEKFPASSYLESAKQHKQQAKNKADNIEKVANTKAEITSLIAQRKWGAATSKANSIKALIENDEYNSILKQIKEERYKPEKTTIDKLLSEIHDWRWPTPYDERIYNKYLDLVTKGKRVEIIGYAPSYSFIDTTYKYIRLYSRPGCAKGKDMEIRYGKTNKASYFFNVDPDTIPCGTAFKVVGNFSVISESSGDPWFEAETIERI